MKVGQFNQAWSRLSSRDCFPQSDRARQEINRHFLKIAEGFTRQFGGRTINQIDQVDQLAILNGEAGSALPAWCDAIRKWCPSSAGYILAV